MHLRDTFFIKSNNPIVKIDTSKIVFINKDTIRVKYSNYISKKENKIGFVFEKNQKEIIVAEGTLEYVAVNEKGKPRKFKPNLK